jgi:hypothetical protein
MPLDNPPPAVSYRAQSKPVIQNMSESPPLESGLHWILTRHSHIASHFRQLIPSSSDQRSDQKHGASFVFFLFLLWTNKQTREPLLADESRRFLAQPPKTTFHSLVVQHRPAFDSQSHICVILIRLQLFSEKISTPPVDLKPDQHLLALRDIGITISPVILGFHNFQFFPNLPLFEIYISFNSPVTPWFACDST